MPMVHNPWTICMATCEAPWMCHGLVTYWKHHSHITSWCGNDACVLQCKNCVSNFAVQNRHIRLSAHIKVDICLFFVAILWLFCRHVCMWRGCGNDVALESKWCKTVAKYLHNWCGYNVRSGTWGGLVEQFKFQVRILASPRTDMSRTVSPSVID